MTAYVIVDIDVTDLEGDWNPTRVVVLEFPSMDQARAWVKVRE